MNSDFDPIVLTGAAGDDVQVIAEMIDVLATPREEDRESQPDEVGRITRR